MRREVVWLHIDQLNGLFDPLQRRDAVPQELAAVREAARARIDAVRLAASWSARAYEEGARSFLATEIERPEDAFGAWVILLVVAGAAGGVTGGLAELPSAVRLTLSELRLA